jgi:hypothetical protein
LGCDCLKQDFFVYNVSGEYSEGCKQNKKKKTAKFLVSEQEVAMPTTRETHHSGKILPFFSFSFFLHP